MPHISGEKLEQKLFADLFGQLIVLQTGLNKKEAESFFSTLVTDTEKIMLTKRCAVILMLSQGHSPYRIWNTLKLSPSTVARLNAQYEEGDYDDLVKIFKKKHIDCEKFWKTLELVLRGGMPSMVGDRWKHL